MHILRSFARWSYSCQYATVRNFLYCIDMSEIPERKYITRNIHTKLHPGPVCRIFQILTSKDIDNVISRYLVNDTLLCIKKKNNKKNKTEKITRGLKI